MSSKALVSLLGLVLALSGVWYCSSVRKDGARFRQIRAALALAEVMAILGALSSVRVDAGGASRVSPLDVDCGRRGPLRLLIYERLLRDSLHVYADSRGMVVFAERR